MTTPIFIFEETQLTQRDFPSDHNIYDHILHDEKSCSINIGCCSSLPAMFWTLQCMSDFSHNLLGLGQTQQPPSDSLGA
jgi:hypothetical protein